MNPLLLLLSESWRNMQLLEGPEGSQGLQRAAATLEEPTSGPRPQGGLSRLAAWFLRRSLHLNVPLEPRHLTFLPLEGDSCYRKVLPLTDNLLVVNTFSSYSLSSSGGTRHRAGVQGYRSHLGKLTALTVFQNVSLVGRDCTPVIPAQRAELWSWGCFARWGGELKYGAQVCPGRWGAEGWCVEQGWDGGQQCASVVGLPRPPRAQGRARRLSVLPFSPRPDQ